jgi:hypothetical protein
MTDCGTAGTAAELCDIFSNDGYSDWFLPSQDQLDSLYVHMDDVGGFLSVDYWSSTEDTDQKAIVLDFDDGTISNSNKNFQSRVRPIRNF